MGQGTGTMQETVPLSAARWGARDGERGELEHPAGAQHPPPPATVPSHAASLCQPWGCGMGSAGRWLGGEQRGGKGLTHPPRIESSRPFGWNWKTDLKLPGLCQCILLH